MKLEISFSLFLLIALILIAFALYACTEATLTLWGIAWFVWFLACVAAVLLDRAVDGWSPWGRSRRTVTTTEMQP